MTHRRKLIEVALPLEAISEESSRRKRKAPAGYPTTIHKWWAQRPLAACRAVLFASLVDDPASRPDEFPTEEAQRAERERLFGIIEELIKWENSNDDRVLQMARSEIQRATNANPPMVLDPFCGGGSIPLEAQRLGLEVHASDLNPVAVLITKALVEIPTKFAGQSPVNPQSSTGMGYSAAWKGAHGLAEDVRYYGKWIREEAERRIGHLYPKVRLPKEHGAGEATAVAWLWARTVECPNPSCGAAMPLLSSSWLSTKPKSRAWVESIPDRSQRKVQFKVKTGEGTAPAPPKIGRGAMFRCLSCQEAADEQVVRESFEKKQDGVQLVAMVAEGSRRRLYVDASDDHVTAAESAQPAWVPDEEMNTQTPNLVSGRGYGIKYWQELFTPRQLTALTTFVDLIQEVRLIVARDAEATHQTDAQSPASRIDPGGYADAIVTYLAFALSRQADYGSAFATWRPKDGAMRSTLGGRAIPMVWDFAEGNPFGPSSSGFDECVEVVAKCLALLPSQGKAFVAQLDAAALNQAPTATVCTDPPYYRNIGYADLADFLYIWLRRALRPTYPDLFSTLLTPKDHELVADVHRFHGSKKDADNFFEAGLTESFRRLREGHPTDFPMTVFYALKQVEEDSSGDEADSHVVSTGWEKMLAALVEAQLVILGTWPMRTEGDNRQVGIGANALASSIVLVCRPRPVDAPIATRREFVAGLRADLPDALKNLQQGNVAPVDLAQATIGPGMAVFSRNARVLEADGTSMRVRTALGLINQILDEVLTEQEGEYDAPTRWAIAWFDQFGVGEGPSGQAILLTQAKATALNTLVQNGIVTTRSGKVRLVGREELPEDWDPASDRPVTVWELTHHLIRQLELHGEIGAAGLFRKAPGLGEVARDLAYRLYTTAERKKWAPEALAYNSLVVAWPEVTRLARAAPSQEAML